MDRQHEGGKKRTLSIPGDCRTFVHWTSPGSPFAQLRFVKMFLIRLGSLRKFRTWQTTRHCQMDWWCWAHSWNDAADNRRFLESPSPCLCFSQTSFKRGICLLKEAVFTQQPALNKEDKERHVEDKAKMREREKRWEVVQSSVESIGWGSRKFCKEQLSTLIVKYGKQAGFKLRGMSISGSEARAVEIRGHESVERIDLQVKVTVVSNKRGSKFSICGTFSFLEISSLKIIGFSRLSKCQI